LETKLKIDVSKKFDQNAEQFVFDILDENIYFLSPLKGVVDVFSYNIENKTFKRITEGVHEITDFILGKHEIIAAQMSMNYPREIFSYKTEEEPIQLTSINRDILDNIHLGKVEQRWIRTTDYKAMLTWVIYPPDFDSTKTYPALLYCQGGPQSMVGQFWSTRWNFQLMAASGYIVVAPNRRGVPGFGQAWNEQISKDYGGQNMKDYLSAIDALAKEPYVDKNRIGACGASYGGFSVYWLAGNHHKRFKAFLAHNGMFNLEQQYLETEEIWFVDWDLGGNFWDKNNRKAQNSYQNSPHKFIQNWDTPICVIHSEQDYRIVASQGMAAYNAALLKGIPARYLYFPDENHWVLKPQNSILWHRNFKDWFDTFLKTE
jgi:dipeptidyl aminopeptidase/acylaminoacyl peptidase